MPKVRKVRNHKSLFANAVVTSVVNELIQDIKIYLDGTKELEFSHSVNRSFANDEMYSIVKKEQKYLLTTKDNSFGNGRLEYEIEDFAEVSVYDLIWIMEQIELEKGE